MSLSNAWAIEVDNLSIHYGNVCAVEGVSFRAGQGEQLTLLGPSGCGKTTTMRAVAGLEKPSGGSIRIGGNTVFDAAQRINVPAEQRGLSMVFQSYAIWPHMTVFENVAYGLRVRGVKGTELNDKVRHALDLVQMGTYADRNASALSGGQQQRVALARACAFSSNLILFDEPLSNLDAKLRGEMRLELRDLQRRLGVSSLYVTHDLEEALAMSDRIIVMRAGRIEQNGGPEEIYNHPRSAFVADFVGSANLVRGSLSDSTLGPGTIAMKTADGHILHAVTLGRQPGQDPTVSMRTVHLGLSQGAVNGTNSWPVKVVKSVFLGDFTEIHVDWNGQELVVRETAAGRFRPDDIATLSIAPEHCILLES